VARRELQWTADGPLLAAAPKLVVAVLRTEPAASLRLRMAARLVKAAWSRRATRKGVQSTAHGPLGAPPAPKLVAAVPRAELAPTLDL